jgi:50S ribosomal subunit-associated GTPase HflX
MDSASIVIILLDLSETTVSNIEENIKQIIGSNDISQKQVSVVLNKSDLLKAKLDLTTIHAYVAIIIV